MVQAIPEGYHSITPYLAVHDARGAIEFYKQAFGATELFRMEDGDRVGHAELQIGSSRIMLADEHPEIGARGPRAYGGSPVQLMLYVENVDEVVQRAEAAGAKITRPVSTQFYGDRNGGLEDPYGHTWFVATHVEDVSPEEMERRMKEQH
ncbi:MAG TPA: VOC family protein [Thermoanaerobaculia bacterium]|nr:VOC family protein [Thermoanaerobaculia bacterium]